MEVTWEGRLERWVGPCLEAQARQTISLSIGVSTAPVVMGFLRRQTDTEEQHTLSSENDYVYVRTYAQIPPEESTHTVAQFRKRLQVNDNKSF